MNAMKNKIKSQRGASITFALLLFLVCAVVSGIVIVAATAASGRMDQIAESDQRYYAVTSAAELLKDALDGKTVTVKTVETSTVMKSLDGIADETTRTYEKNNPKPLMTIDGVDIELDETTVPQLTVLGDAAYRVANAEFKHMDGVNITDVTVDYLVVDESELASMPRPMTLRATAEDADIASALAVEILETGPGDNPTEINENIRKGFVTFYVSKKDSTKSYTLKLTFKADVKTNVDEQTTTGTPTANVESGVVVGYSTKVTTTRTTETTMDWILTGIVKSDWISETGA